MKKAQKLIDFIKADVKANGGKLVLHKTKSVKWGSESSNGFFDESDVSLHVATNYDIKDWLGILVHEYCHFQQYLENCYQWRICYDPIDVFELFEDVLKPNVKYDPDLVHRSFNAIRNLELDCERRTVKMLKEFNSPINVTKYCQGASAYVFFYNYVSKHKKWYKKDTAPYRVKAVYSRMPDNLNGRYDKMPKWMENLFAEHCV
tara:strand:- start:63526 stop:64137 length:612 start_codon:yes stop_codon:yes gene_type:complete